jgi:hypothetical protein
MDLMYAAIVAGGDSMAVRASSLRRHGRQRQYDARQQRCGSEATPESLATGA